LHELRRITLNYELHSRVLGTNWTNLKRITLKYELYELKRITRITFAIADGPAD